MIIITIITIITTIITMIQISDLPLQCGVYQPSPSFLIRLVHLMLSFQLFVVVVVLSIITFCCFCCFEHHPPVLRWVLVSSSTSPFLTTAMPFFFCVLFIDCAIIGLSLSTLSTLPLISINEEIETYPSRCLDQTENDTYY